MKFSKLDNRGSLLIVVLIIMSILTMLGTVIITLAMTNYKMKIINNKAKFNFYLAEAGLDEAYGIIGNIIEDSIDKANNKVSDFIDGLDLEDEIFKEENGIDSPYVTNDGLIDYQAIEKHQETIFKEKFREYIQDHLKEAIENQSNYNIGYENHIPLVKVKNSSIIFDEDTAEFDIESSFTLEDIERKVTATFQIKVPDYKEPYFVKERVISIPKNIVISKSIAIDGNLYINGGNSIVNGDLFVKGSAENGGILVDGQNTSTTLNGIVATDKNIAIYSNSKMNILGEVFAKNIIIDDSSNEAKLHVNGSVYTWDDLELNGNKSEVEINGGYYGISDGSEGLEPDTSSSIIINSDDLGQENGSKLTITGNIIICGTSYISTYTGKYQTGESLSIKGNYKAYMYPLSIPEAAQRGEGKQSLLEENIIFDYYDPLVLASKFKDGNKLLCFDKSDYFYFYNEEYGENGELNLGSGITIEPGDIFLHLGAIVYDNLIYKSNFDPLNDLDIIVNRIEEYKRNVNCIGYPSSNLNNVINIKNIVNFGNIDNYEYLSNTENKLLILNNDDDKKYALIGNNAQENLVPQGAVKIYVNHLPEVKGIIISSGDIYLVGNLNFKGTIIGEKDLIILDNETKTISYDEKIVSRIIAENQDKFSNIFNNNYILGYIKLEDKAEIGKSTIGTDVLKDTLIKIKNWKISY